METDVRIMNLSNPSMKPLKFVNCFYHIRNINRSIIWQKIIAWQPGPGCSKLMTSLVNETLKFQTLVFQICQYFLSKKCEKAFARFSHFFNKNISIFGYKAVKHLTSWPLNELIKLRMLWTTRPWTGNRRDPDERWLSMSHLMRIWTVCSCFSQKVV